MIATTLHAPPRSKETLQTHQTTGWVWEDSEQFWLAEPNQEEESTKLEHDERACTTRTLLVAQKINPFEKWSESGYFHREQVDVLRKSLILA